MMTERMTLEQQLTAWMEQVLRTVYPEADFSDINTQVVPTADDRFGDYQCNAAMALAGRLRKPPREIAQQVVSQPLPDCLERVEIAGPGFINMHLRTDWLAIALAASEGESVSLVPPVGSGKTVVIDYSSPNVAKPMHIGHIRSTVIGNALDRIYRSLGYRVIADNHVGDWGTQFGLMILGYKHFVQPEALERDPIEELERIYRESYNKSKEEEAWLNAARSELLKLQQGDPENLALWKRFIELSKIEFNKIYDRLGVRFDIERGESSYNEALQGVVDELDRKGLLQESEGAQVVNLEEEGLAVSIVRKSDGAFNYTTTDLATALSRHQEFNPDEVIYVTDERQQLHFKQVFAILRKMDVPLNLRHVWFGLMRLPDATFSTRQGNVIKLEVLLDEAEKRALDIIRQPGSTLTPEQQQEVARAVGIGAVKYADLSQNPQSLVTFTWEKAMALDGNSAPYLQYAYARISSVRDKYRERFPEVDPTAFPLLLQEPIERRLAVHLLRFGDTVIAAARTYRPNYLADYCYALAQLYSTFYQTVPFLKAEEGIRESRVRLCGLVARTLRQGLDLLGIETPERI